MLESEHHCSGKMAPPTDKTIRIARFFSYPKIVIYILLSILLLVAVLHWLRLCFRITTRHRVRNKPRGSGVTLGRWPLAVSDWIRATSMRRTISLLWNAQVNWLEAALTVGYMTLLLAFIFAGSKSISVGLNLKIRSSDIFACSNYAGRAARRATLLREPRRHHCGIAVPDHDRARHAEQPILMCVLDSEPQH